LKTKSQHSVGEATYWLTISLLVGVPLAFSPAVYRMYSAPKFLLLLTGAAALLPLLTWTAMRTPDRWGEITRLLASRHVLLVSLYLIVIVISTLLGVSPVASLFGSSYDQMGLLTHLCFFIVFISLVAIVGASEKRFHAVLWAITLTGLAVATYAFMQFFGKDPFIQSKLYTVGSESGALLRVNSTIGHSNYLGNFLLYVAPLGAGLGFASHGRARRIGLGAAVLSAVAIVFTGTRGAWLGLVVAALVFVALARSKSDNHREGKHRVTVRWAGGTAIVILVLAAVVSLSPASRTIVLRARSLVHDATGAGRTLLWRDSMRMVKDYALVGCGPEGFRKAFLPYKSDELASLAPETNNESSHNSFIDAALSYGLAGAILYVAIIASSFSLLLNARWRATDRGDRIIASALVSAFAAVVVHNFFIFDQISTGLYFFVFAGLAQIASNKEAAAKAPDQAENGFARTDGGPNPRGSRLKASNPERARDGLRSPTSLTNVRRFAPMLLVAGSALFVIAAWYSIANMLADIEINKALASARVGSLDEVVEHGERAISYPDPAGDYHMLLAQCLTLYSDLASDAAGKSTQLERTALNKTRNRAISLAMFHAEQSLAHTLTADSNYVLLAYLALQIGDADKLFTYAGEAVRRDPKFSNSHWLMAEADLGRGDREGAASEARVALYLNPNSREARSALKRARGAPKSSDDPEQLIKYARELAGEGSFEKARRVLLRTIRKADGHCAECHSALASLCEGAGLYADAISEWHAYEREAPEQALAEKTALRIERLMREGAKQH
jgi:O-antigen ligase/tetratricopeptide (TPR) repeat protein